MILTYNNYIKRYYSYKTPISLIKCAILLGRSGVVFSKLPLTRSTFIQYNVLYQRKFLKKEYPSCSSIEDLIASFCGHNDLCLFRKQLCFKGTCQSFKITIVADTKAVEAFNSV